MQPLSYISHMFWWFGGLELSKYQQLPFFKLHFLDKNIKRQTKIANDFCKQKSFIIYDGNIEVLNSKVIL